MPLHKTTYLSALEIAARIHQGTASPVAVMKSAEILLEWLAQKQQADSDKVMRQFSTPLPKALDEVTKTD